MSLLANSNAIESGGYNIDRSLRFRSSASAYLNRTFGASNRTTWTWSGWVKRGALGAYSGLFSAWSGSGTADTNFGFNNTDNLRLSDYTGSSFNFELITTQVFRDPSAWYHVALAVDTTQATSSNRVKLYINGSQVTSFSTASYPSLNAQSYVNSANTHYTGYFAGFGYIFDGYLAEVNFIDGQALTPSSFGETATTTGAWIPKKYGGTYGTNGFYLPFSDNTSATTLAYDKSGNGNNWTPNNISTTAGATYDSMTDVPTLTSATAANYCVLNPLDIGANSTNSDGNLKFVTTSAAGYSASRATIGSTSGKWYFEVTAGSTSGANVLGIANANMSMNDGLGNNANGWGYASDGNAYYNGATTSTGASWVSGDVLSVAFDADSGKLWFAKNGTWVLSGNPSAGTSPVYTGLTSNTFFPCMSDYGGATANLIANFGQRPFSYTPPTGFKALNTFNLPDPTIKKPNQYMDATLYTGTGSNLSVVNAGAFQPSLVWAKARSTTTNNNFYDAVRGTGKILVSNNTDAEVDVGSLGLSAFNSNGFSLGTGSTLNDSGQTYVGWQWKESATAGFDIVTYTGTGSARTISHNLGVAPSMMIVKRRDSSASGWIVYHKYSRSDSYDTFMVLNSTDAVNYEPTAWNSTTPTSSVFSLGTYAGTNANTGTFVNYLFAEIPGYSKFGSYTGNGSADGQFVYCGFRPRYILVKRSSTYTAGYGDWYVYDTARMAYNVTNTPLYPNSSAAESGVNSAFNIDILSNGFKVLTTYQDLNLSGTTYIYAAFAENPFKYSNAR